MRFDKIIGRKGTYCTQWDFIEDRFGRGDLLPFTISDTDFEVPIEIKSRLMDRIQHGIFGYTRWKHQDFENSILNWYLKRFGLSFSNEYIVYSPSVIFSISLLINLLSEYGDKVILQTPAYDAFYNVVTENNRQLIENPLMYTDGKYTIDWIDLESKLKEKETKILLFCSPHNPTGRVWNVQELSRVIELCKKYDVFIISDEIHMDIISEGYKHHPLLEFTNNNIAVVTSASKTFNFPGLIFSYALIPDSMLREKFVNALKKKHGLSSASTLGMLATMEGYNNSEIWVNELNDYLDENRNFVKEYLSKNIPQIHVVDSEATYLMWLDVSGLNYSLSEFQYKLINEAQLAIMSGETYGGNGEKFIRLNIGCPMSKLKVALEKIKGIL